MTLEKDNIPKPTTEITVCGGIARVIAYGKIKQKGEDYDWSLQRQTKKEYDLARNVLLQHARHRTLWAPKPTTHNGLVLCPLETHFHEIDTGQGAEIEGIIIRRGVHADGVILHSKLDAFLMTPADCATVVLSYRDPHGHRKVIAMHASRGSLIDLSRFKPECKHREHEGIIESAFTRIPKHEIEHVQAWVGISVSPGAHFAHRIEDKENPHNGLFVEYIREKYGPECFADDGKGGKEGWLDKRMLVKRQLTMLGVPEKNIDVDTTCTYSEKNGFGEHRWYSHIRGVEEKTGPFRNLVLVIRNH